MKHALLFGASGFVGSFLLRELLQNPEYDHVTAITRKKLEVGHPKLENLVGDSGELQDLLAGRPVDDAFIAIGTTKKKTPNQDEYYRIDHDYPVLAASVALANGASSVLLVSAIGADPASRIFYVRTKGEAERDIIALGFRHTHIFRPSMILGKRPEHRPMEKALIAVWKLLAPLFVGGLKKYRGTEARDIARAMNNAANRPAGALAVYEWSDMRQLLN